MYILLDRTNVFLTFPVLSTSALEVNNPSHEMAALCSNFY